MPYSSIIQAFGELVGQLLSENEDKVLFWRTKILGILGPNGKVLTDIIPDIEFIIGKQPEVPILDPEESQNRFNYLFRNFISIFTSADHPIILFLDDLQWADVASLNLIKTVISSPGMSHLLIVGAYRDNEVDELHPLVTTLNEIKNSNINIRSITLRALDEVCVNRLVSKFVRSDDEVSATLSTLVYKISLGNPFFINQFMKTLYDAKMLEMTNEGVWNWDVSKIDNMHVTDNVVHLLADKITRLPEDIQDIVKVCACIGNRFDLESISIICEKSVEKTLDMVTYAVNEGIIEFRGNLYSFHHDRIQEAAYSVIPKELKAEIHYRIGNVFLNNTEEARLPEKILFIVDQLNAGLTKVVTNEDACKLAKLNLMAGRKSKTSTAYDSAVRYLNIGIDVLPHDSWSTMYELSYSLFKEKMECEYLNVNFKEAEKLFHQIIENAITKVDKANVYTIMMTLYTSMGNYKEAINLGLEGTKMMGVVLSRKPSRFAILMELVKLRWYMGKRKIENLIDLPQMKNEEDIAITYLLFSIGAAAYYVSNRLFSMVTITASKYFAKKGNFEHAPYAYAALAPIIGAGLGFYKTGYRFAHLSLRLNDKYKNARLRCKIEFLFAFFSQHWFRHARENIEYLNRAYKHGIESGDLIFSGHAINTSVAMRIMLGDNLDTIFSEAQTYKDFLTSGKDPFSIKGYLGNRLIYRNLKGTVNKHFRIHSNDLGDEAETVDFKKGKNKLGLFNRLFIQLRVLYLLGDYEECFSIALQMEKIQQVAMGNLQLAEYYFYYSLTVARLLANASGKAKKTYWKKIGKNQKKMKKWAKNCPDNFQHKYLLIDAEIKGLKSKFKEALDLYDRAAQAASANGYIQNEAIAYECAAGLYFSRGDDNRGRAFIEMATEKFALWGATAKVEHLKTKYPIKA